MSEDDKFKRTTVRMFTFLATCLHKSGALSNADAKEFFLLASENLPDNDLDIDESKYDEFISEKFAEKFPSSESS